MDVTIYQARQEDAEAAARLVHALLTEITLLAGGTPFQVDLPALIDKAHSLLQRGVSTIFLACEGAARQAVGLLALCEGHALYAGGAFGVITELYVVPEHRSAGVGQLLIERAQQHASQAGWGHLEVTTPPLPAFERTVSFYQRQGFAITGGRKLKLPTPTLT